MRVSLYMAALLERFRDHVARLGLFPRPGAALVAVSGGPDSVALLDLMSAVAGELGLRLVVAHADHGIQTDSRLVGQAVRQLAEQYGLPFQLEIGRASCRERVEISVVAGSLKKKKLSQRLHAFGNSELLEVAAIACSY